jgi:hypothetical protein
MLRDSFGEVTADVLLTKPLTRISGAFHFYRICREKREPTSGLEPLTPAPTTSLLAYVPTRTGASGNCACLGAFQWSGGITLSIAYQRVSARLQYIRGRHLVLGTRFAPSARGPPRWICGVSPWASRAYRRPSQRSRASLLGEGSAPYSLGFAFPRWRVRSQPQRDVRGLHRLPHYPYHLTS